MSADRQKPASTVPASAPGGDDADAKQLTSFHQAESSTLRIELLLSPDRMKLFLRAQRLAPATAESVTAEALRALFPPSVPPHLLDNEILEDTAASLGASSISPLRRVAKGSAPVQGKDGKIVWLVRAHPDQTIAGADAWVRPNDVQIIESFDEGRAVARIYPPGLGTDGFDALGRRIPGPSGNPVTLLVEGALKVEPVSGKEWEQLVAHRAGYIRTAGGRIVLEPELRIAGDVDNHCGSVEFAGAVRVRGSVISGFFVQASGDITVEGDLSGGAVISAGGSVDVRGAVVGTYSETQTVGEHIGLRALELSSKRPKQEVSAAGTVRLNTVSNSRIIAGSDIFINHESLHSRLRTRGALHLPHGHLIGGESFVTRGIDVDVIGTPKGAKTVVSVSSDVESTSEGTALASNLKSHETALEALRLYLGPYADSEEGLSKLDTQHRSRMVELRRKMQSVLASRDVLLVEQEKLHARSIPLDNVPIIIRSWFHPGAEVIAGDRRFTAEVALEGPIALRFDSRAGAFNIERNPQLSG